MKHKDKRLTGEKKGERKVQKNLVQNSEIFIAIS